jgi:hypothetical protein
MKINYFLQIHVILILADIYQENFTNGKATI